MIKLLIPLGLLGLLSIIVLLLIYIIKPNYQVKYVLSTHIWKLSLNYRKKKLPTNTLRNIIIIICQILILTCMAFILAKPVLKGEELTASSEIVIVVDSSASMMVKDDAGDTRFSRALEEAIKQINTFAREEGFINVIIADSDAEYFDIGSDDAPKLVHHMESTNARDIVFGLRDLGDGSRPCSYGSADVEGALELCRAILSDNPDTKIYFYTDTEYAIVPKQITVVPVKNEVEEWNMAILDASYEDSDGYYSVNVDFAVYGEKASSSYKIYLDVVRADGTTIPTIESESMPCENGVTKHLTFYPMTSDDSSHVSGGNNFYFALDSENMLFNDFKSISVRIDRGGDEDSFPDDNVFYIYGGDKEIVRIEYVSVLINPFFTAGLDVLRSMKSDSWNIVVREVNLSRGQQCETEGYDFYIFEDYIPQVLPVDGAILFANPNQQIPQSTGIQIVSQHTVSGVNAKLGADAAENGIMKNIDAEKIEISLYNEMNVDSKYDVLMTCEGYPVMVACNDGVDKMAVMTFSVHYSNFVKLAEWVYFIENIFDYYFPMTLQKYSFEVYEDILVDSRAQSILIEETEQEFAKFPLILNYDTPGSYTIKQTSFYTGVNKALSDVNFFVRMPQAESEIFIKETELGENFGEYERVDKYDDLLVWIAAALVLFMMIEWWLHSRESR